VSICTREFTLPADVRYADEKARAAITRGIHMYICLSVTFGLSMPVIQSPFLRPIVCWPKRRFRLRAPSVGRSAGPAKSDDARRTLFGNTANTDKKHARPYRNADSPSGRLVPKSFMARRNVNRACTGRRRVLDASSITARKIRRHFSIVLSSRK